ncbi:hypothetical protein EJ04DRAFT_525650 [Polyplosphaeria fusca]|uniref:Uncharacterized protein n=1 Tax=Polyplosphaeria fusca TaxID=682080 RepID=A0A9P4V176_9PLEO|nr:hypothetical protein EJ04DRAFT_525650 [Polyplosphaeria fusca]
MAFRKSDIESIIDKYLDVGDWHHSGPLGKSFEGEPSEKSYQMSISASPTSSDLLPSLSDSSSLDELPAGERRRVKQERRNGIYVSPEEAVSLLQSVFDAQSTADTSVEEQDSAPLHISRHDDLSVRFLDESHTSPWKVHHHLQSAHRLRVLNVEGNEMSCYVDLDESNSPLGQFDEYQRSGSRDSVSDPHELVLGEAQRNSAGFFAQRGTDLWATRLPSHTSSISYTCPENACGAPCNALHERLPELLLHTESHYALDREKIKSDLSEELAARRKELKVFAVSAQKAKDDVKVVIVGLSRNASDAARRMKEIWKMGKALN